MKIPKITIIIPAYEMHGDGAAMLMRCLESVVMQNFQDYEIVVSDNSIDLDIRQICNQFDVRYVKNRQRGMASNTNHAISQAKGELIKILFQDDMFKTDNSLREIVDNFGKDDNWLVTGCTHTNGRPHFAEFNNKIYQVNTIGSPSVLTIRNDNPEFFNNNLRWVLDCDYYMRLFRRYGKPKILNSLNVIIGIHENQETNHLTDEDKLTEQLYLIQKYDPLATTNNR